LIVAAFFAMACSSSETSSTTTSSSAESADASCPTDPVAVVVSVDQWGDIVEQLAGGCGDVTTIIEGSADDPHDYEPTTADTAAFGDADLVVMNGLDYDHWAEEAVETLDQQPAVVNGGEVVGLEEGDNPHIWYGPDYVTQVADAVTTELSTLAPAASEYFADRAQVFTTAMQPYFDQIEAIRTDHPGATYAATESVFDYMGEALGMQNLTPAGYQDAAANESDPAPGDVNELLALLQGAGVDVLVYNTQTEGAVPEQLRGAAESAGVPVVEVTETVSPGTDSFVTWQVAQLEALAAALS
jgi:zinc/manganese transport system substrate-binding protein